MTEEYLTLNQAAAYIKYSPSTLRGWRIRGEVLPVHKPQGKLLYKKSELDRFLAGEKLL